MGGFIKDKYQDYGYLGRKEDGSPKYDMYELLAFWNSEMAYDSENLVKDKLLYDGSKDDIPTMKEIDQYTNKNRSIGINIGCYGDEKGKFQVKKYIKADKDRYTYGYRVGYDTKVLEPMELNGIFEIMKPKYIQKYLANGKKYEREYKI